MARLCIPGWVKVGMMITRRCNYGRSSRWATIWCFAYAIATRSASAIGVAGIATCLHLTKNVQDAANKFVSFAASPESKRPMVFETGYMPINKYYA